jgi:phosphoesterase RecJ-like protein
MASIRIQRVAEQIQQELSSLLVKGLKDPRIGFVTITGVEVSADLGQAWVYFCTTGNPVDREQSLLGLQSAAGFIRKTLGKRLHLRTIPEFHFKYDDSLDKGNQVEQILSEVREKEGWDDPTRVRGSAEEVCQAILSHQRFLVTTHLNPDGDAVASVLAMRKLLLELGKEVVCYNPDRTPDNFRFLPGSEEILDNFGDQAYDATIVLDCSELKRTGPLPEEDLRGDLIGIDHHLTTTPLGDSHYLDPGASSIGEIIERLYEHLPIEISLEVAQCIYCSILADTGSFRYSNTTPKALRAAARMVAMGVSPWDTVVEVYESIPATRIELLAKVLQTFNMSEHGRYGSIIVRKNMLEETGATPDLLDGFINFVRSIKGVEVSIQFREVEEDSYKISFRSRGNINVADIAKQFEGGGHANAAGCTLKGPLETVQDKIFKAVESSLAE